VARLLKKRPFVGNDRILAASLLIIVVN